MVREVEEAGREIFSSRLRATDLARPALIS